MERRRPDTRAEGMAAVVALITAAASAAERPAADEWPGWPGPCIRVTMRTSPPNLAALLGEPPADEEVPPDGPPA